MQQRSWAVDKIWEESYRIDKCFSYSDEDGEILQSRQGTVIRVLREERKYVTVEINLSEGDKEVSWDKFLR
jgi:hypothetical protein